MVPSKHFEKHFTHVNFKSKHANAENHGELRITLKRNYSLEKYKCTCFRTLTLFEKKQFFLITLICLETSFN